jgi:serine/threonine protein kinase
MFHESDQIGPYTLIRELGRGAFTSVWLTERRTLNTTKKAVLSILLDNDIEIEKLEQEVNYWMRASGHPNVLPVIEANIYSGQVVIASEYISDGSLESWLKHHGGKAPSIEAAIEIVSGILAGLEHLHSRMIIHRDLKPANILLHGRTPHLVGFGVSHLMKSLSHSHNVPGACAYMSPEVFESERYSAQTDVWSAGVILYEMLTGNLPYPQKDVVSLIGAISRNEPDPLPEFIPPPLRRIVARALAKDPRQRFSSAAEMQTVILHESLMSQWILRKEEPEIALTTLATEDIHKKVEQTTFNEKLKSLHIKATLGETLTEEEKALLESWYEAQDEEERALLEKFYEALSLDELQNQVKDYLARIVALTQSIQELTSQNEALKRENAKLQNLLAERLDTKAA